MKNSMNEAVAAYKQQLEIGDIQVAYQSLVKYVMSLKAHFTKTLWDKYSFGNVSPGYMDYTYFPFFNKFLRSKKLRFGIVLNHSQMRFELWLMGQNAQVQKDYWEFLKATEWNQHLTAMPTYSVLETVLVEHPDFNDLATLSIEIEKNTTSLVDQIIEYIRTNESED